MPASPDITGPIPISLIETKLRNEIQELQEEQAKMKLALSTLQQEFRTNMSAKQTQMKEGVDPELNLSETLRKWTMDMVSILAALRIDMQANQPPAAPKEELDAINKRVKAFRALVSASVHDVRRANSSMLECHAQLQTAFATVEKEFGQIVNLISIDDIPEETIPVGIQDVETSILRDDDEDICTTDPAPEKVKVGDAGVHAPVAQVSTHASDTLVQRGSSTSKLANKRYLDVGDVSEFLERGVDFSVEAFRTVTAEGVMCDWYVPEQSIYDCAILVFSKLMYFEDSVIILITLCVNILLQATFLAICRSDSFTENALPTHASAQRWRYETAHDVRNLNLIRETSLASRVCGFDDALDIATGQATLLQQIVRYLQPSDIFGGESVGVIMSVLAALLWLTVIMQEVLQTINSTIAIWGVPRGFNIHMTFDQGAMEQEEPELVLLTMSTTRVYLLLLINLMRLAIAIVLGIFGVLWLGNTISITDLVLNAVALVFVLEQDEILFSLTTSLETRWALKKIQPIPNRLFSRRRWHRFIDASVVFGLVSVSLIVFVAEGIVPMRQRMTEIRDILCGGPKDFVIARQVGTMMFTYTETKPQTDDRLTSDNAQRFGSQVVEGIINSYKKTPTFMSSINTTYLKSKYGPPQLLQISNAPMDFNSDWWGFFRLCKDTENFRDLEQPEFSGVTYRERRQRVQTLKMWTGMWDATNCSSFGVFPDDSVPLCDNEMMPLLRTMCPAVCGCDDPRSGLLYGTAYSGCPETACRTAGVTNYTRKLEAIECRDPSPLELAMMPGGAWKRYWFSAFDFISRRNDWDLANGIPSPAGGGKLYKSNLTQIVMWAGCDALSQEGFWSWCLNTIETTSLRAFCPIACGCALTGVNHGASECPLTCSNAHPSINASLPEAWKLQYYYPYTAPKMK